MSTYTFYSAANDGALRSLAISYEQARAGTSLVEFPTSGSNYMIVGQSVGKVYEDFLRFDTNSVPDSYTITAAVLATYLEPSTDKDFSVEARTYNWGTTLETSDFVPGANLSACALLASYPATAMSYAVTSWYSDIAFTSAINKSGYTRMVLCSSNTTQGIAPTGTEDATLRTSEYAGTSQDPCLTVTAVPPSGGYSTRLKSSRGAIW